MFKTLVKITSHEPCKIFYFFRKLSDSDSVISKHHRFNFFHVYISDGYARKPRPCVICMNM